MKPWVWTILKWIGVICMLVLVALAAKEVMTTAKTKIDLTPINPDSKGVVVLAVGLPASGKSTWFKENNIIPLSADAMRIMLFDNVAEQGYQEVVFSNLRILLRSRLKVRMPRNYVDATNLTVWERANWITIAKEYGYETQALFFDVPVETCLKRNRVRKNRVPDDVMHKMAFKMQPPVVSEGFSKVVVVS